MSKRLRGRRTGRTREGDEDAKEGHGEVESEYITRVRIQVIHGILRQYMRRWCLFPVVLLRGGNLANLSSLFSARSDTDPVS
jgi:hypothetical protein